ncbi:MAG: elongation factor G, partial [Chloroflexota bacterium]
MPGFTTEQIRNVALLGHNGTGKTSLADAMSYVSGQNTRLGRVDDGTSISDFEPEEQHRHSSVQTAILPCPWNGAKINLLDTPGYADFVGEMISALHVSDAAVIVLSASAGIEVGAAQAWTRCEERSIPRLIVVNKLDRENTDFEQVVSSIQETWGRKCVPIQIPDGASESLAGVRSLLTDTDLQSGEGAEAFDRLAEAVADTDDELAEKYLEEETLSSEDLIAGLKAGVRSGAIVPVLATSVSAEVGVKELLDAIVDLLPSPADALPREDWPEVPAGAQANLVFKTSADPFVGKLSYFRVYGAPFKSDSHYWNANRSEQERVGQVFTPKGKEHESATEIATGDIGLIAKLAHTQTGDTLSEKNNPVTLPGIEFPEPFFGLAVAPKTKTDLDKMAEALSRIAEEDPSLRVDRDTDTHETVIRGVGDTHVEMTIERVQRKFGVQLETSLPRIAYRETIGAQTKVEHKHKKQSGGHGQYGHVIMQLDPLGRGEGFAFQSKVVGGNVPKEYIPSVEKGVKKAMEQGPIAGFPVVDVGVTLLDGSSHSVDSSGMAFEIAGSAALRKGIPEGKPTLL